MKRKGFRYPLASAKIPTIRESATLEETALVVNVRTAKDQLSSLLEAAARGDEVVITSDGQPKAKLVGLPPQRRRFKMHWAWLRAQTLAGGPPAEMLIRGSRQSTVIK